MSASQLRCFWAYRRARIYFDVKGAVAGFRLERLARLEGRTWSIDPRGKGTSRPGGR